MDRISHNSPVRFGPAIAVYGRLGLFGLEQSSLGKSLW